MGAESVGPRFRHEKTIRIDIDDGGLYGRWRLYGQKLHYGSQAALRSCPAPHHDDRDPRWSPDSLSGLGRWSEEELQRLELGVVGAFARGRHDAGIAKFCLLSAVGSSASSRFRYARVMGMKEDAVRNVGFAGLAIFRPGIIVGNAHTPAWVGWLGSLVPGSFGSIDQRIFGRSIAVEIACTVERLMKLPAKMKQ